MSEPLLVADGLTRTFAMGAAQLRVLRGCSLAISAGEFITVMGKSGSGKSTLLHILGALDVPQQGQVTFRRQPVFAPAGRRRTYASAIDVFSADERRRIRLRRTQFGFVFQFYHLLPELTVAENVLLPRMISARTWAWPRTRAAARADALAILERVGLSDRLKHLPQQLSGGERQRVALARALVHKPAILFADEPTGNLDRQAGQRIMKLLQGLHADGQTIVMVTHDPTLADFADRLLHLEDGRLVPVTAGA